MKKTLVVYASKTGTTRECAKLLKEYFPRADYADLTKEQPDPTEYDLILCGAGVRMGMVHKKLKKWIAKYHEILAAKEHAFFICNGNPTQVETVLIQNFGKELLETSICATSFGGYTDYKRFKGMDRFIMKMLANQARERRLPETGILKENIKAFAETIREQRAENIAKE